MAITPIQKQSIAKALRMTPTLLDAFLTKLGATLTSDLETDVLAELTRFSAGTVKGRVWFTPTESNEGFNLSTPASADTQDPRDNIAGLLEIPAEYCGYHSVSYGTISVGI